jgi:hypothetical protein
MPSAIKKLKVKRCQCLTEKGKRCKRDSLPGEDFCSYHEDCDISEEEDKTRKVIYIKSPKRRRRRTQYVYLSPARYRRRNVVDLTGWRNWDGASTGSFLHGRTPNYEPVGPSHFETRVADV